MAIATGYPGHIPYARQDGAAKISFTDMTPLRDLLQPEAERTTPTMNYDIAVLIINPEIRVVRAIYNNVKKEDLDNGAKDTKTTMFKTFDPAIAVDDLVMVPSCTRHSVTCVKVTEVDVDWDPNTHEPIKWIIGKIDRAEFGRLKKMEEEAIHLIKDSEKRHQREELRKKVMAHVNATDLEALQISSMGGNVIEPPLSEADKPKPAATTDF
jgi:hypothetical protein